MYFQVIDINIPCLVIGCYNQLNDLISRPMADIIQGINGWSASAKVKGSLCLSANLQINSSHVGIV